MKDSIATFYLFALTFVAFVGTGKLAYAHFRRNGFSIRVRRITVIGVTFIASFSLFLTLDALLRGYDDSHVRFLVMAAWLILAAATGHHTNFVPW
jgi:hypothetical protein